MFDLLTHPSIMCVEDPKGETFDLVCDLVAQFRGRAALVEMDAIAKHVKAN